MITITPISSTGDAHYTKDNNQKQDRKENKYYNTTFQEFINDLEMELRERM